MPSGSTIDVVEKGASLMEKIQPSMPPLIDNSQTTCVHVHIDRTSLPKQPMLINTVDGVYFRNKLEGLYRRYQWYIFACLVYIGANVVGLMGIAQSEEEFEADNYWIHVLEFLATFLFAIVELFIVRTANNLSGGSQFLSLLFCGLIVVATFVTTTWIIFDKEKHEVLCHWIEFVTQLPIIVFDVYLAFQSTKTKWIRNSSVGLGVIMFVATIVQMCFYGDRVAATRQEDGSTYQSERASHWIEFTLASMNAIFAIGFTYVQQNKVYDEIVHLDKHWWTLADQKDDCKQSAILITNQMTEV